MLIISKSNGEIVQANPEIVLFDKDGTLIDVHHYWSSMLRLRGSLITEKWFKNHSKKNSIERELIEAMGIDLLSGKIKVSGPVGIKSRKFIENIASNIVSKNGVSIEDKEMEDIFLEVDDGVSLILHSMPTPEAVDKLNNNASWGSVVSRLEPRRSPLALLPPVLLPVLLPVLPPLVLLILRGNHIHIQNV